MSANPKVSLLSGRVQQVDYTPASAVAAGDVIVINGICHFSETDIAAATLGALTFSGGVWQGNKDTSTFSVGDPVYWAATGSPVTGTASSGAFTSTGTGNFVGYAVQTPAAPTLATGALTGDQYVYFVKANSQAAIIGTETDTIGASTAAAGSTTSDAGVLPAATASIYPTTAADDTKGVRINAADKVTGRTLTIGNGVANKILKVYAPSGGVINGGSADAAFSSASGKGVTITCLSGAGNTWLAS